MVALPAPGATAVRVYVVAMLAFLARGVAAASRTDPVVAEEITPFPEGFTFEMGVLPRGPALRLRKEGGALRVDRGAGRPTVAIRFKHLRHAARVLAFVDTAPSAMANQRFIVDGDTAAAMRMQRVLERVQAILLPERLAAHVLKRPTGLGAAARVAANGRLYARMARDLASKAGA